MPWRRWKRELTGLRPLPGGLHPDRDDACVYVHVDVAGGLAKIGFVAAEAGALLARGCQTEDGRVAGRHAGALQHAALAEQTMQAPEVVVRNGHEQVMLEVVIHVVGGDEEPLPPA